MKCPSVTIFRSIHNKPVINIQLHTNEGAYASNDFFGLNCSKITENSQKGAGARVAPAIFRWGLTLPTGG